MNKIVNDLIETYDFPENITCELKLYEKIHDIMIDDDKMRRAIINIIDNSVNAMPEGGKLFINSSIEDNSVILKITDTGVGIPKSKVESIFEPLFTTKTKGLGLGLAVVKEIIEKHGGSIEVETTVNKGTTFKLKFKINNV